MYPKAPLKGLFGPEMAIYGLFSLVLEYWDRGVPENGTIQIAFKSYHRIQSPDLIVLSFVK